LNQSFIEISFVFFSAYCTPTSNIHKEKFLIIWTLIGQELKQAQLVEFWKNVPISVLYEHRYLIFYIMAHQFESFIV
jgi:hypothetical protein